MNKNYLNEEKVLFAVYGTLRKGHGNNRLLTGAKYLGDHKTNDSYTMYDGGFPIVERDGQTPITIEVYEATDPRMIRNVFGLEGCSGIKGDEDNWYDFDEVDTPYGQAVMFVMDKGEGGRTSVVPSGNWKN